MSQHKCSSFKATEFLSEGLLKKQTLSGDKYRYVDCNQRERSINASLKFKPVLKEHYQTL